MEERVCVCGKAAAQYGAGVAGSRKSAWLWNPGADLEVSWGCELSCAVGVIPALWGVHVLLNSREDAILRETWSFFLLHLVCGVAARTCAVVCFVRWFQTRVSLWKSGRGGHWRHKGRKRILLGLFYAEIFRQVFLKAVTLFLKAVPAVGHSSTLPLKLAHHTETCGTMHPVTSADLSVLLGLCM